MAALSQRITLPHGRLLGYDDLGPRDGLPVFYFHGSPSSRIDLHMFGGEGIANRNGVRIISVDRPGMGLSTFQPGRRFLDWPSDLSALADELRIERFAILAHSGGAPYALSCAQLIPERLSAVGIVSGTGPFDQPGLAEGINPTSRQFMYLSRDNPRRSRLILRFMGTVARFAPGRMAAQATSSLPEPDRAVMSGPVTNGFVATVQEALRSGPHGAQHDTALMIGPWDIDPTKITMPVHLWHGEADQNAPVAMGRYLAAVIPECHATFYPNGGHLSIMVKHIDEVVQTLVGASAER